jgi:arylsulfatase A-like enzyme
MLFSLLLLACTDGPGVEEQDSGTGTPPLVEPFQFDGPPPRNVLMVSIDTFRKDHLDPYGDLALTPFLGRLANEGVRLDDHVQCSNWTWHATSCTLAGRYELDVGHVPVLLGERERLPDGIRTLARVLSEDHQYGSVLQSKNGWLGPQWNNAQGYTIVNPPSDEGSYNLVISGMAQRDAAMLRTGGDHWLAHIHLLEPHAPYVAPEEYWEGVEELPPLPEGIDLDSQPEHYASLDELANLSDEDADVVLQHMRLRYQAEIRWVDAQLEAAFAALEGQGALDDTLVVVWTDHGEAFYEHGAQTHAHNLYAEENDAVLFFWAKNLKPFVYEAPTHAVDLLPTVLSILDLPLDDDLAGYPLGMAPRDRVRFTSTVARQGLQIAALKDDHKLLYRNRNVSWSLFDHGADPGEKLDLLGARPDHPIYEELQPLIVERIGRFQELFDRSPGGL